MLAIMASVSEPIVIWLYTKKTNIMEMLQGLSFIFTLWGAALILLDIKDIADKLGMGENSA
jgi:predicted membrane protein